MVGAITAGGAGVTEVALEPEVLAERRAAAGPHAEVRHLHRRLRGGGLRFQHQQHRRRPGLSTASITLTRWARARSVSIRICARRARRFGRSASRAAGVLEAAAGQVPLRRLHRRFGDADADGGVAELEDRQDDTEHRAEALPRRGERALVADGHLLELHRRAGVAAHAQTLPRGRPRRARRRRAAPGRASCRSAPAAPAERVETT